jgi:hypothetical protein
LEEYVANFPKLIESGNRYQVLIFEIRQAVYTCRD